MSPLDLLDLLDLLDPPDAAPVFASAEPEAAEAKALRNLYDRVPAEVRTSANVALWWPQARPFPEELAARVLVAMEDAWAVYRDDLGLPPIAGTESTLFNVYLGDGTPNWPAAPPGVVGTHFGDPAGVDLIVLRPDEVERLAALEPDGGYLERSLHHELFHAIHGYAAWVDGSSSWIKEASAEWAATRVDPDNAWRWYTPAFLLLRPNLALNHNAGVPDGASASVDLWHEYGAQLYLDVLSEDLGDAWLVDFWRDARRFRPGAPSWAPLADSVTAAGGDPERALHEMAVRNVTLDYTDGAELAAVYADLRDAVGDSETTTPVALTVRGDGTSGLQPIPDEALPQALAYNHVVWQRPTGPWAEVVVDVDPTSSLDRPAAWLASAVVEGGPDAGVYAIPPGAPSELRRALPVRDATRVTLVVSTATPPRDDARTETFGYRVALTSLPAPTEAAGCDHAPARPALAAALALLASLRRADRPDRRRRGGKG